jgi:hypothetical protein
MSSALTFRRFAFVWAPLVSGLLFAAALVALSYVLRQVHGLERVGAQPQAELDPIPFRARRDPRVA